MGQSFIADVFVETGASLIFSSLSACFACDAGVADVVSAAIVVVVNRTLARNNENIN